MRTPGRASPWSIALITLPYLLVLNIALHQHEGGYWADPLWRKDLEAHLAEIADLAIACPVVPGPPPPDWRRLSSDAIAVHPLPAMGQFAVLRLPIIGARLWRAIGRAAIVHTGVAGWPFPLGWLAVPIAKRRHRRVVVVVESAFWRLPPGANASRFARARAAIWERINRRVLAACDASFFTSRAYRDELHRPGAGVAHVIPAVWIDDDQLIAPDRLAALAPARRGRLLFAGRLTASKGVDVLLAAAIRSGVAVDFVGEGDLRPVVAAAATAHPHSVALLDPVEYGADFMALLDRYAALVVPTLTDEQPRVIFDGFARGLAVLASDTSGNREVVEHGRDGLLHPAGDIAALAAALVAARDDPAGIEAMGIAARARMAGRTHAAMHATRAGHIAEALGLPTA